MDHLKDAAAQGGPANAHDLEAAFELRPQRRSGERGGGVRLSQHVTRNLRAVESMPMRRQAQKLLPWEAHHSSWARWRWHVVAAASAAAASAYLSVS
jgi:hypothetical protein